MSRLQEQTIVVTGAASGIGAACASRLANEGAHLVGIDIAPSDATKWNAIRDISTKSEYFQIDITEEDLVQSTFQEIQNRYGKIDGLVNAAGVAGGGLVHDLAQEDWDRVIRVNLTGTYLCCKHALKNMLPKRKGAIVNIASIEGVVGLEAGSAYNASKGAVVLLTKNLAIDYARAGIRTNCICPGLIRTSMTEALFSSPAMQEIGERFVKHHAMGRYGQPEEIASVALFLLSDDASFVTGHALIADGGMTAGHSIGAIDQLGLL